MPNTETVIT